MPTKYHHRGQYRTQFRKLAFGEAFWLASNTAVAPFIKASRTGYSAGRDNDDFKQNETTVADTTIACVRVPGVFLAQNRTLS